MLIIDLQQVMIATLMAQLGSHKNAQVDENLLRHMILNTLRANIQKYPGHEVVIACDGRASWRRSVFPYYKAHRKKKREESELDWNSIFRSLDKIKAELKEFFPYRVIHVARAEADDIIGVLAAKFGGSDFGGIKLPGEAIVILSGDKDFIQLQKYGNVSQYNPVLKKKVFSPDPERFLKDHIIRGDSGDGVPNIMSADDTFVRGARQKPTYDKKVEVWLNQEPEQFCNAEMLRNYRRNEQLIDLSFTPEEIEAEILSQYEAQAGKDKSKLFNYFIQYKLKHLMGCISEF